MNLSEILDDSALLFPAKVALVADDRRLTYAEVCGAVASMSDRFADLGIAKGDKVALLLPNCPEFVIAYFASVRIGAVAVTINTMSTAYELRHILADCDAKIIVTVASTAKRYQEIKDSLPLCRHCLTLDDPEDPAYYPSLLTGAAPSPPPVPADRDDPAVIIYTSGLTGRPLGAVLTHGNLLSQSCLVREMIGGNRDDSSLSVIPLFHSFGAVGNMLAAIRVGAGMVLMERFTLEGIFATLERERVTYLAGVPRLFLGMLFFAGAAKYNLSALRVCITGGAPIPPEFISQFQNLFRIPLLEGYGLTEASPVCYFNRLDIPQKIGSIGRCVSGVEGMIADDEGRELVRGTIGEVLVRGSNIMRGYYKNDAATRQVIRNGWLHTGDLGYMDEDGYVFLTGRKKRMIITSGFNVYPREVETVMERHEAVAAAVAIGQEDLMRGEIVKVLVVKKQGVELDEKEVIRYCRQYLSAYKVPRIVEFVPALPLA